MGRDTRTYITVHDGMPEHRKVVGLSDAAFRLWVETLCWCSRQLSDGQVADAVWKRRGTPRTRKELVDAGLVEPMGDGWYCHDYLEHQRSRADVEDLRSKRQAAGRQGGLAKAAAKQTSSNGVASASPVAKQMSTSVSVSEVSETDDSPSGRHLGARKRATRLPDGWMPSEETRAAMRSRFPHVDLRAEHEKFTNYWSAASGQKATKQDWNATWRNWVITAAERTPPAGGGPPGRARDFHQERTDDYFARNAARLGAVQPQEVTQ